jgi:hypothetical protein
MENPSVPAFLPTPIPRWDISRPTAYPPLAPPELSGTYCPVLFFDIAAFGDPKRDNDIQMFARDGLYQILRRTFAQTGLAQAWYYRQDYGDGVLAVLQPTAAIDSIASLPAWLQREIQRYNKCASEAARIQLRAVLHIGPIYWDDHGVCGDTLIHAARLIDAQPIKDELAAADADLVFAVSEPVYGAVIRHSPQPGNLSYRQIRARVKESQFNAWITVVGGRGPAVTSDHQPPLTAVPDIP